MVRLLIKAFYNVRLTISTTKMNLKPKIDCLDNMYIIIYL